MRSYKLPGLLCALLTVAIGSRLAVKSASASDLPPMALYTLDCGLFFMQDADVYSDEGRFQGSSRVMVNPCYLIRHGSDYMMWDVGMPDYLASTHGRLTNGELTLTMPRSLAGQLAELHVAPDAVRYIAVSHQDLDHVGNTELFSKATLLIDEKEYSQMFTPESREMWIRAWGDGPAGELPALTAMSKMKAVKIAHTELYDVFGDSSVVIYPAPGHTPGHRVLLVRLPQAGAVLLTGDLWHLRESRQWRTVPRITQGEPTSPEIRKQLLATMDMVEQLAGRTRARVVSQHVPDDFFSMPASPDALH